MCFLFSLFITKINKLAKLKTNYQKMMCFTQKKRFMSIEFFLEISVDDNVKKENFLCEVSLNTSLEIFSANI